jgi:hypothetical protein
MDRVRAYVYSGMWVADCPRPWCGGTELLHHRERGGQLIRRKTEFMCSSCLLSVPVIEWCPQEEEIMSVLMLRPVPHTRNWYPKDHEGATRFRIPHGQSAEDLRDENRAHGVPGDVREAA